jgi:hypothetical protein
MSLAGKLQVFRSLSREEKSMALQAILACWLIETGFRTAGVVFTQRIVRRWAMAGSPATSVPERVAEMASRMVRIARRNTGSACLGSSLAL